MAHRADLDFPLPPGSAGAVVRALEVEATDGPEGTTTALRADGDTVHVEVTADSVSGLRAALNSAVRLLDAAVRTP